jgi:hypothetical protein
MHVSGDPEPNLYGTFRPRGCDTIDELLDPVLPDHPRSDLDLLRRNRGDHREVSQLLRLQAPGLTLSEPALIDHVPTLSNICSRNQADL